MRRTIILAFAFGLLSTTTFPQAKTRRLPSIINHPSLNLYAPYISFDGNALLFISNNGQDGALIWNYTSRETDWREPVELPKHINTRLNFLRGYALSADGKKIYYTSAKSPVVGGYDIFISEQKGSSWAEPQNLALPINTKANEACPAVTTDGNTIYFMRCDKMDQTSASGCKLFRATKKSNGQWEEPAELPAHINTGNSQVPRIMADGETLIFSSDKNGGKGGMDLFLTRFKNGTWSAPVALDFVNTDKNDAYVSVAALGRYLLKEGPGAKSNIELTEYLFPTDLRPGGMMKVEGKVTDANGAPLPAYVSIVDLRSGKRVYSGRPATDGSYSLYLPEGTTYEMSVDPEQSNTTFFSRKFDLTSDKIPQKEKVNVTLKQPSAGDEIALDLVQFKTHSANIDPASEAELKRLVRLAKANPQLKFEIQVLLNGYVEDVAQSAPDLTEVIMDSVQTQVDDIDTLGQLYQRDTIMVRTTYHNDRTLKQAQAIINYLVAQGADAKSFTYFGNAIPATVPENKKLTVKAVIRGRN